MTINNVLNDQKGSFEAISEGVTAGLITYVFVGDDKFIIDHTEVSPDFNGQGVGKKLILAAVDYARENNFKIIPLCPFAKSVFDKNEDLNDVL
ncbi:MAG: N-acetyltransferase [Flavobacterium sp.]|nr:N-acetyltransferase [Candidatus Neoflavobacterium equi]